jgi:hypothetical protein
MGDIFDMPRKKKDKKTGQSAAVSADADKQEESAAATSAEPEEASAAQGDDAAQEPAAAEDAVSEAPAPKKETAAAKKEEPKKEVAKTPEAEKPKKKKAGADLFDAGGDDEGAGSKSSKGGKKSAHEVSSYLDDAEDLDEIKPRGNNAVVIVMSVVIVALLGVIGVLAMDKSEGSEGLSLGEKVKLVLKGEYREYRESEKKRKEDEFTAAQLAALERYGNLTIMGSPLYASIRLNGQTMYAPIGAVDQKNLMNNTWREIRLKPGVSSFADLKIKQKIDVEIASPGYETRTYELTEGMWQGSPDPGATSAYTLNASLTPVSMEAKAEYDQRMTSDVDNNYYGKVTINTVPAGAKIFFNKKPLLNEKGEELVTPVTFTGLWERDEKTGKMVETQVKVDTVFDNGHTIELSFPGNPAMPRYATMLERQMWECTKKTEDEIKKLPKGSTVQHQCDYTFTLNMDFNALQGFVNKLIDERRAVEEHNKKVREKQAAPEEGEPMKMPSKLMN